MLSSRSFKFLWQHSNSHFILFRYHSYPIPIAFWVPPHPSKNFQQKFVHNFLSNSVHWRTDHIDSQTDTDTQSHSSGVRYDILIYVITVNNCHLPTVISESNEYMNECIWWWPPSGSSMLDGSGQSAIDDFDIGAHPDSMRSIPWK